MYQCSKFYLITREKKVEKNNEMRKRIKRRKDVRDKEERMKKEWNISFSFFCLVEKKVEREK